MRNKIEDKCPVILLADDNPADHELARQSFGKLRIKCDLHIVDDGVEVLDYLYGREKFQAPDAHPWPDLILLDINMPRMDGKQVLREIKTSQDFKTIPVIMLSTSSYEKDVIESYKLGANAYMTKPVGVKNYLEALQNLENFWFMTATLPSKR